MGDSSPRNTSVHDVRTPVSNMPMRSVTLFSSAVRARTRSIPEASVSWQGPIGFIRNLPVSSHDGPSFSYDTHDARAAADSHTYNDEHTLMFASESSIADGGHTRDPLDLVPLLTMLDTRPVTVEGTKMQTLARSPVPKTRFITSSLLNGPPPSCRGRSAHDGCRAYAAEPQKLSNKVWVAGCLTPRFIANPFTHWGVHRRIAGLNWVACLVRVLRPHPK